MESTMPTKPLAHVIIALSLLAFAGSGIAGRAGSKSSSSSSSKSSSSSSSSTKKTDQEEAKPASKGVSVNYSSGSSSSGSSAAGTAANVLDFRHRLQVHLGHGAHARCLGQGCARVQPQAHQGNAFVERWQKRGGEQRHGHGCQRHRHTPGHQPGLWPLQHPLEATLVA